MFRVVLFLSALGGALSAMPTCSSAGCPSVCSCVESDCGSQYSECAADSQCDGLLTCLLGCSCGNIFCELGCVEGKTLDSVSTKVKSCATSCATSKSEFEQFKERFGKTYSSDAEESRRFQIFKAAAQRVKDANARNGKEPVFGITFTADLNIDEKTKRGRKGNGDKRFVQSAPVYESEGLLKQTPKAVDWRLTKAVTAVKNQGQCGSCWAFSTAEEVESQYIMQVSDDYLMDFSAQQIASCVSECDGCGGGDTVTAYQYLKTSPGLAPTAFWPYAQGLTPLGECSGTSCTQSCSAHNLTELAQYAFYVGPYPTVTGFSYATPPCTDACADQDLKTLAESLAESGPVSICVNAGAWDDYTGGVMTAEGCGGMGYDDIDHCVQLVGFNATAETPYWIVRNSWTTSWGMSGYIHLEYGKNTCGLADEATIAEVKASAGIVLGAEAKRERWARLYEQATGGAQDRVENIVV